MFNRDLYDTVLAKDLAYLPNPTVSPSESMESVIRKFQKTQHYNLPVVENGRYYGFISRANTFSAYQKIIREISED